MKNCFLRLFYDEIAKCSVHSNIFVKPKQCVSCLLVLWCFSPWFCKFSRLVCSVLKVESFRFDYEYDYDYEIRHLRANRVIFCCRDYVLREQVVAVALSSTRFLQNLVVLTTSCKIRQSKCFYLFFVNLE